MKERLPQYLITVPENQYNRLNELDSLIDDIEKQLTSVARQNETCRRLLDIPGARAAALLTKGPGPWITELKKRRPASVAIVAMANKLVRTV